MTSRFLFLLCAFVTLTLATWVWMITGAESGNDPPGTMGDDIYFENIAWHLAQGKGIWFDFRDATWRAPYQTFAKDRSREWVLALEHAGPTTSRAPGFPLLVAGIYQVAGRNFFWVRVINLLLLAAGLSALLTLVYSRFGLGAAALATATMAADLFVLRTAGQFMTECLAAALTAFLWTWLIHLVDRTRSEVPGTAWHWFGFGLLFGYAMLVRANMNAWFLQICVALFVVTLWKLVRRHAWKPVAQAGLGLVLGVVLFSFPWWARNCQVTGGFTPFGTSGSFGLVGGYCDAAYRDFGNWNLQASVESQNRTLARPGIRELTLAEQEYQMGLDSTAAAKAWARDNWTRLPALVAMKGLSHLGFYRHPIPVLIVNGLMYFGLMLGCYATWHRFGKWLAVVFVLSLITTSLTWPHYGRYSIPIRPLLHVGSSLGTIYFWTLIINRLRTGTWRPPSWSEPAGGIDIQPDRTHPNVG